MRGPVRRPGPNDQAADQAVPPGRARVGGTEEGGRRDALGCARPAGHRLPLVACVGLPALAPPPAGAAPMTRADGSSGPRVAFPLPPGLSSSEHAALGALRRLRPPPGAAADPRRLHRPDPGHGALGRRPGAVRRHRDRRRHRRLRPRPTAPGGHVGRGGPATPGCDDWRAAVALPHRRAAAPGGGPGPRALGDRRPPARRALGAHRRAGLGRAPDGRPAVSDHHPPLVWCQSGAVHHALRRPQ